MARHNPMKRILILLAALALVLASCAGASEKFEDVSMAIDGEGGASDAAMDEAGGTDASMAQEDASEAEAPAESDAGPSPVGDLTPADLGRSIIFTGYIELEVENVAISGTEAIDAITSIGGFVFGQNTVGGVEPRSEITFKVRPEDFDRALVALGGVGEVRVQTISASDVTERVVDLGARIEVAALGVDRLRAALENATDLADFAEIERLLLARESELEVMRGQLRTIQDQVDLATITLVLTQDRIQNNVELLVSAYETHDSGASCTGSQRFTFDEDIEVTLCFEMTNVGDQTLNNVTLTDTVLGITADTQLIPVFGTLADPLEPGQSVVVAYEITAERSIRPRVRVVANPTSGIDGEAPLPAVSTEQNLTIDVRTIDKAPGFGDGFAYGKAIVASVWTAVQVIAGFLVPLLVLLPFLWLLWKGVSVLTKRRAEKQAREKTQSAPPPPTVPDSPDSASPEEEI